MCGTRHEHIASHPHDDGEHTIACMHAMTSSLLYILPGDPANTENGGMTVPGANTVLSSTRQHADMIHRFPMIQLRPMCTHDPMEAASMMESRSIKQWSPMDMGMKATPLVWNIYHIGMARDT